MRHHAKFRGNWSNDCRDIAIFRFFKMMAIRNLGLEACPLNKADLNSLDFVIGYIAFYETLQNFKLGHSTILSGTVLF